MLTGVTKFLLNARPQKGRSGGSGGGGGGNAVGKTTLGSVNWASPDLGGSASELETVSIDRVWADFQRNGLTDISRARVETQKRLIREAQESGTAFRAPDLSFASAELARQTGLNPGFDVIDGRHRVAAFRELGFKQIKARVDR